MDNERDESGTIHLAYHSLGNASHGVTSLLEFTYTPSENRWSMFAHPMINNDAGNIISCIGEPSRYHAYLGSATGPHQAGTFIWCEPILAPAGTQRDIVSMLPGRRICVGLAPEFDGVVRSGTARTR